MLHLHRAHRRLDKGKELSVMRLFLALGMAMVDTVWALHMDAFGLSAPVIGFSNALLVIVSLATALVVPKLLQKHEISKLFCFSILTTVASYIVISLTHSFWFFMGLAAITTVAGVLRLNTSNIIFRDNVKSKDLNREEGFLYVLLNIGWFVGPFIAALGMQYLSTHGVFLIASGIVVLSLLLFLTIHTKALKKKHEPLTIITNIKAYFSQQRLRWPYLIVTGLEAWWGFVYIYMPLIIIEQGGSETAVAVFLGLVTLPLVISEYAVGKLSEKHRFNVLFTTGFTGMAGLAVLAYLFNVLYLQIALIILASFFVSFIEPLQDTFFFKLVKRDEEDNFYPVFNTAMNTGSFLGKFVIAVMLLLFPLNTSYLIIAGLMVIFAWRSKAIRA